MPAVGTTTTAVTSCGLSQPSYNKIVTDPRTSYEEEQSITANGDTLSRPKTRKALLEVFKEDDHLFCCPLSLVSCSFMYFAIDLHAILAHHMCICLDVFLYAKQESKILLSCYLFCMYCCQDADRFGVEDVLCNVHRVLGDISTMSISDIRHVFCSP